MSNTKKLLLVGVYLIALTIAVLWFLRTRQTPSVAFVDNADELEALLLANADRGSADLSFFRERLATPELVRRPVTEDVARILFPPLSNRRRTVYDPTVYFRNRPNLPPKRRVFEEHPDGSWPITTNNLGFRNPEDVATSPDLRVLVAGDSHTEGVIPTGESFTNVLAAELRARRPGQTIEALNAGKGSYSFYNYLGVLEKYLNLQPDVFVMAVYGGNDFKDVLALARYFHRLPPAPRCPDCKERVMAAVRSGSGAYAQAFNQLFRFKRQPETQDLALYVALATTYEAERRCRELGIRFVGVYIPPFIDVQPRYVQDQIDGMSAIFDLEPADLTVTDALADRFLRAVQERGISFLDLRDDYRRAAEPAYWVSDHHINTAGHRRIAERLLERL